MSWARTSESGRLSYSSRLHVSAINFALCSSIKMIWKRSRTSQQFQINLDGLNPSFEVVELFQSCFGRPLSIVSRA